MHIINDSQFHVANL